MTPIIYTDYYKTEHFRMYPENTSKIVSNLTPRKSRLPGVNSIVVFGPQHFIKEYLLGKFKTEFFDKPWEQVEDEYKYAINTDTEHIRKLHDLGYLPLTIMALPEGTRCPIRVPCLMIWNTLPEFYWLTNYLETLMSCQLWQPITSATIAAEYWKILSKYAKETTGSVDYVQWQGHDFSMRGMSSLESAILSGMAHLAAGFTGTDTIPAIYALRNSYGSSSLIGNSVPATEHSVMCMGTKDDEVGTFRRLLNLYPSGILSIVSDTWDLWKVITEILPTLKDEILARDGKLVIRPDSGDPVDIICGLQPNSASLNENGTWTHTYKGGYEEGSVQQKGVIELLWDLFGGKVNELGYKELDSHIGAIYGDSITLGRAEEICKRLKVKGFASTNIVLGIGSYTYQYNTRDTFGFAVKATYGELEEDVLGPSKLVGPLDGKVVEGREIFKDPVTDDGTKKSAKGLTVVLKDEAGGLYLQDQATWADVLSPNNQMKMVFKDGVLLKEYTLDEIRERIKGNI